MCGIVGVYTEKEGQIDHELMSKMVSLLRHRGPDHEAVWAHEGMGLGHARLSIRDVHETGHQPMRSASGDWVIVFNGEIYNADALKKELDEHAPVMWRGHSDTEVVLHAIQTWGLKRALQKSEGMFALAVVHQPTRTLSIARDRFGEKPLYYGEQKGVFAFASELKSLKPLAKLGWIFEVNPTSLNAYLQYAYVPTPWSIFSSIHKLMPGTIATYRSRQPVKMDTYWSTVERYASADAFRGTYNDAVDELDRLFQGSIKNCIVSDQPVGSFLSGGIDSSLVVAMMQRIAKQPVKTFSIGFSSQEFDESPFAEAVSKHLGTDHHTLHVDEKMAMDVIPSLPDIYDEPFADSSQIPTILVSQLAKKSVAVSLTGDGGDELFGGYRRYIYSQYLNAPFCYDAYLRYGVQMVPGQLLRRLNDQYPDNKYIRTLYRIKEGEKRGQDPLMFIHKELSSWIKTPSIFLSNRENDGYDLYQNRGMDYLKKHPIQARLMTMDMVTYLLDDILVKVDRAAMSCALETRVPFLNTRIFQFSSSVPLSYKIRGMEGKRILRDVLYRYVPKELVDRPKQGFAVPVFDWLRHELYSWANQLLSTDSLAAHSYFDVEAVRDCLAEHRTGVKNNVSTLWPLLMFQSWYQRWYST